jgi:gamma-glutamylcyclotransferase (GGCT)/AIG2-like uncharacterized protein YtfP
MSDILHFGYGSNISTVKLQRNFMRDAKDPSAVQRPAPGQVARLEGYSFALRRNGTANIVPDPNGVVYGVVHRLPKYQYAALAAHEGTAAIEEILKVTVTNDDGNEEQLTGVRSFRWNEPLRNEQQAVPYYMELIVEAAERAGLPQDYIDGTLMRWLRSGRIALGRCPNCGEAYRYYARYFAYGSNMDRGSMQHYCPRAVPIGAALLPGHSLEFNHFSAPRGCGVADIEPSESAEVWGVLYEVPDEELARLDGMESQSGEPNPYRSMDVMVYLDGDESRAVPARTYAVADKEPGQQPSPEYMQLLAGSARLQGVPEEYCQWLEGLAETGR